MKQYQHYIIPALLALVLFFAGLYLGRNVFGKHPENKGIQQIPSQTETTSPLLNPFLKCIEEKGLSMVELISFKPRLKEYISKMEKAHPDIHIAYYFRDMNNGLWIGIHEKELFSPASLMKVPVMVAVLKEAESNKDLLLTKLQYKKEFFKDVDEESGFAKEDGAYYTVDDLLRHMICYSDNAATMMLIQYISPEKVEQTEKALNIHVNPATGLNDNFVKIKTYAGVFRILYNASYLSPAMSEKGLQLLCSSAYKGGIREAISEQYTIAHKYGERDHFGKDGKRDVLQLHHFAMVYYPRKPFVIGIMTRGADKATKEKVIKDLTQITYEEVDRQVKNNRTGGEEPSTEDQ